MRLTGIRNGEKDEETVAAGARGAPLGRAALGAGRPARDHLARADEHGTAGRCGRSVRADSRTDPRRGRSEGSAQRDHPGSRPAPRNARGHVEYVATFALAKPVDLAKASRVLVYQVVNRGNGQPTANASGDISLVSGWQGDVIPTAANQTIVVPVARKKDGSPVTGRVHRPVLSIFPTALTAPRFASPRSARHSRTCPPISHSPTRR